MPQFFSTAGKPIITPAGKPSFGGCGACPPIDLFKSYNNPGRPEQVTLNAQFDLPQGCSVVSMEWDDGNGGSHTGAVVAVTYPRVTATYIATFTLTLDCGGASIVCVETLAVGVLIETFCDICNASSQERNPQNATIVVSGSQGPPIGTADPCGVFCELGSYSSEVELVSCNRSGPPSFYGGVNPVDVCCAPPINLCWSRTMEIFNRVEIISGVRIQYKRLRVTQTDRRVEQAGSVFFFSHQWESQWYLCDEVFLGRTIPCDNQILNTIRCTNIGTCTVTFGSD